LSALFVFCSALFVFCSALFVFCALVCREALVADAGEQIPGQ
jgi:hypothetical protein